ncbi:MULTISPECIES: PH domain-containing protein [unclassified Lysobacter]|uniref:PH domain-containing protein n=1 Tax=unclassified Lysobacter TaxID=2635362 RepID=UPI001BE59EA9|nr:MULTISPECIES: PH domain-containing protein [unclassified Lysobacter]MBT2746234.1 PH domain-containing protein [Lysobacter sp. ISL-42]MBT2750778.1 PH domain-containing protein [Lysobacter sp. ISL-50]MBT2776075.1 PH domain-containing protein [Lysobacter sp. ISL-54]MBT2784581.1 PH domain-containing protein [Lysobacter sp. ISL-52]
MTPVPPQRDDTHAVPAPATADATASPRDDADAAADSAGVEARPPPHANAGAQPSGDQHAPEREPGDAAPAAAASPNSDWQRLPARAIPLCTIDISLALALVAGIAGTVLGVLVIGKFVALASGLTGALFGAGIGMWIGFRRYRNTLWRLDEHGFAVRRGVAWRRETLVPLTRVQHLDLKHGPLQRMRGLATLVVHTAGTRHSAVAIDHLDADDAQRLRERLGRQLDHEDDEA